LELEEIDFDLVELLEGSAAGFTAMAAAKGLDLVVDAAGAEGLYRGDPTRVRQVVSNLISNAVKFTASGEVRITARRLEDERLEISVADTGVGISPEVLERLFEKFVQADRSTTRRFGGTGLGLAICRELAILMGGTMTAQSAPGEGARFTLTAPLRRLGDARARAAAEPGTPEVAQHLRILAAEDNPVNQDVLKTIFDQAGVDIAIVDDGAAAVEAYRSQAWDMVLMDVQMPVMDGSEATRLIREIERKEGRPRTPVIGLTADAMAHQRLAFLASGMDRVVAKPLQIAALFGAIEELLAGPGGARPEAARG
jgi:CheY-like chemotaxis protein/anti-sigma regulatory factor (Ser/Thr protein kinase)